MDCFRAGGLVAPVVQEDLARIHLLKIQPVELGEVALVVGLLDRGRGGEEVILVGGAELRGCRHGPEVMAHIVPVTVCEPGLVAGEAVLAVKIHHVGGPVQFPHGILVERDVAGQAHEQQLIGGLPGGVAVGGHGIHALLVGHADAVFLPLVVAEGRVHPAEDRAHVFFPLGEIHAVLHDEPREGHRIDLGLAPPVDILEERAPFVLLQRIGLHPFQ